MQKLSVFEVHGVRVLTTRQLATMYETKPEIINNNFTRNKGKYVLEKHYIAVSGEEMRSLRTSHQFDGELKRVSRVYFWTEKGALLHAKSLNTDKAWEVYDYLVDYYFRAEEKRQEPISKKKIVSAPASQPKPYMREVVNVPENPSILKAIQKIRDDLTCMDVFLQYSIRYTSEKAYADTIKAAADVVPIIVEDWNKLYNKKPKLIQKQF